MDELRMTNALGKIVRVIVILRRQTMEKQSLQCLLAVEYPVRGIGGKPTVRR